MYNERAKRAEGSPTLPLHPCLASDELQTAEWRVDDIAHCNCHRQKLNHASAEICKIGKGI